MCLSAPAAPCPPTACFAPAKAKKLAAPGGGGVGGSLSRSVRVREEADLCSEEATSTPAQPAPIAQALLARLLKLAGDRLRLALALRAGRTGDELRELLAALATQPALAKRLGELIARLAPPATMDTVADCWNDLRVVLEEAAALTPAAAAPAKPPRKRGRFWG
jgi:hypothetical protein